LSRMQRREFVTALGGVTAMWPFTARAQQSERMRRIGVPMSTSADDPEGQARIAAFSSALHQLGWTEGRNAEIHRRWPKAGEKARKYAADLVALAPDVIVATGVYVGPLLQQATQTARLCSYWLRTRSVLSSSRAWRDRAAMRPVFPSLNTVLARSGWSW
jgi:putative ABC transport system substrate-binding protein